MVTNTQKTRSLILLGLVILTLIMTMTLTTTATLAKEDDKKVYFKVTIEVDKDTGKTYITIEIYKNGEPIKTVTFDPPGPIIPGLPGGEGDN